MNTENESTQFTEGWKRLPKFEDFDFLVSISFIKWDGI